MTPTHRARRVCLLGAALAAAIVAGAGSLTLAQTAPAAPTRDAILGAARTIIGRARYATLVTVDAAGAPQARVVEPFPVEADLTVWMATTAASRKVAQIGADGRVSLLYFDAATPGYVSFVGTATIVRDPAEKAKRWNEAWAGFYKERNRGDDYTLIRLRPSRLEISSPTQGMNNDPATWTPVTLIVRDRD